MRKILDTIIQTDHEAKQLAKDAEEKQKSMGQEIDTQKQAMRQMYAERAKARLEKIRAEEEAEAQRLTDRFKEKARDNLARLEDLCKVNENKWVDEITARITKP